MGPRPRPFSARDVLVCYGWRVGITGDFDTRCSRAGLFWRRTSPRGFARPTSTPRRMWAPSSEAEWHWAIHTAFRSHTQAEMSPAERFVLDFCVLSAKCARCSACTDRVQIAKEQNVYRFPGREPGLPTVAAWRLGEK